MPILSQLTTAVLTPLQTIYSRLFDSSTPLVPFVPKPVKLLFLLLVLLNSPSLPLLWHLRVWLEPLKAYYALYTKGRKRYVDDWLVGNQKTGGIRTVTLTKRIAWTDDCDYNMHLSNSSYAKNLDAARMEWCILALSPLWTPKSHAALAASHYVFFKEIPLGAQYTMETRCGGWGEKWFYLITEFVIYPRGKGKGKGEGRAQVQESSNPAGPALSAAALSVPVSAGSSGTATPVSANGQPTAEAVKAGAAYRARQPRADGGVVCCLAVSEYCFKMGRVTIPPRIALHLAMLSPSPSGRAHARNIIFNAPDRGRAWLRGGWRDEPDAETLGRDIGLEGDGEGKGAEWIERGRDGMARVVEGLSTF